MATPVGKSVKATQCSVEGCEKPEYVRTFCSAHYSRWYRHGSLDDRPRLKDSEDLFWKKVDFSGDCWIWTAYCDRDGYGLFSTRFLKGRAARLAYLLLVGDLDPGLVMDHLCRNRSCVNPYHLEPVTNKVNCRRGEYAQRTHCKRAGHPLSGSNLYVNPRGLRGCKRCRADTMVTRYRDKRLVRGA